MDIAHSLSSADVLVLLKLAAHHRDAIASVRQLESELGLSKSSVGNSIRRLRNFDLVKDDEHGGGRLNKLALRDFLEHAVRWLLPAKAWEPSS